MKLLFKSNVNMFKLLVPLRLQTAADVNMRSKKIKMNIKKKKCTFK